MTIDDAVNIAAEIKCAYIFVLNGEVIIDGVFNVKELVALATIAEHDLVILKNLFDPT